LSHCGFHQSRRFAEVGQQSVEDPQTGQRKKLLSLQIKGNGALKSLKLVSSAKSWVVSGVPQLPDALFHLCLVQRCL